MVGGGVNETFLLHLCINVKNVRYAFRICLGYCGDGGYVYLSGFSNDHVWQVNPCRCCSEHRTFSFSISKSANLFSIFSFHYTSSFRPGSQKK